jgi:hypothetical protein
MTFLTAFIGASILVALERGPYAAEWIVVVVLLGLSYYDGEEEQHPGLVVGRPDRNLDFHLGFR